MNHKIIIFNWNVIIAVACILIAVGILHLTIAIEESKDIVRWIESALCFGIAYFLYRIATHLRRTNDAYIHSEALSILEDFDRNIVPYLDNALREEMPGMPTEDKNDLLIRIWENVSVQANERREYIQGRLEELEVYHSAFDEEE